MQSFIQTNAVITAAWGVYFLVAALLRLIVNTGAGPRAALMILSYVLLLPMFIFTDRFQKWYPEQLIRSRHKTGRS